MASWNSKREWDKMLLEISIDKESGPLLIEARKVETWEELIEVLDLALQKEDMEKAANDGGEAVGKLAKNAINMVPALGTVWSTFGMIKDVAELTSKLRKSDSSVEENPIMSSLKIDPGYSELLDNNLEKEFIVWFKEWIGKEDRTGPITGNQANINSILEEFLKERGDHDESVFGGESAFQFTDIPYPKDDKLISTLKKATKGFLGNIV